MKRLSIILNQQVLPSNPFRMPPKKKQSIGFPFILDLLEGTAYHIRPMFGCHAIYGDDKILIILRNKEAHPESNGVWIATDFEHHPSLKKTFKGLKNVELLSAKGKDTAWQMIHYKNEKFEEQVGLLCELIMSKDPRIGKIPKRKNKRAAQ